MTVHQRRKKQENSVLHADRPLLSEAIYCYYITHGFRRYKGGGGGGGGGEYTQGWLGLGLGLGSCCCFDRLVNPLAL